MAARPLRHPEIESVRVVDVLHALADPIRLAIVAELMEAHDGLSCVETIGRVKLVLPKSTCSQHYQILREAGLIRCERKGVELSSRLRLCEIDERFPGLLEAVLRSYRAETATAVERQPAVARVGHGAPSKARR
jgi:DNA-binding transcriptional ArsR family regulator